MRFIYLIYREAGLDNRVQQKGRYCQPSKEAVLKNSRQAYQGVSPMQDNLWAIVLAGGEGDRMRPLIESWLGSARPKQYCTFVGTRSMLRHTLDRTNRVVNANQVVTVIGKDHLAHLRASLGEGISSGRILEQPMARGTATGVFLAATYILAADPNATFVILPSDHFVYPEPLFVEELREFVRMAEAFDNRLILVGVKPDRPEPDYGWIQTGSGQGERIKQVRAFWEKPAYPQAAEFLRRGDLWNTMVMAAKGRSLWRLGKSFFPAMMEKFESLRSGLEAIYHGDTRGVGADPSKVAYSHLSLLQEIYEELTPADFSTELLQWASDQTLVFEMDDRVLWCDWGRPERIWNSLRSIRKTPRFSEALALSRPTLLGA